MTDPLFQIKGTSLTVVVLELYNYSPSDFLSQLTDKVQAAAHFFEQSPVLINLEKLVSDIQAADLLNLVDQCRQLRLQPVAIRGSHDQFGAMVEQTGLALLPETRSKDRPLETNPVTDKTPEATDGADKSAIDTTNTGSNGTPDNEPAPAAVEAGAEEITTSQDQTTQIISRQIRSGQQVYSAADLIIIGNVNEGAEVLAQGNIHIYGTLRGRALAGVQGNTKARIFCQQLSAELIAIAGNFLPSEAIHQQNYPDPVQVYRNGENLEISAY
ncbi:MAG: septum site-determining protein MinC [Pseudomonadales bacterium]|nr:septum site-determining protein MinC [Pseudomonadales bacterium]